MDTAANLSQIRLIIIHSPVMKSKDKTNKIWKNEEHDLMAHENSEGIRHEIFSHQEIMPLCLVTEACFNYFVEEDRSRCLMVFFTIQVPGGSRSHKKL